MFPTFPKFLLSVGNRQAIHIKYIISLKKCKIIFDNLKL